MSDRILCYDTRTRTIFETTEDDLKEKIEKVNNMLLNRIDPFAEWHEHLSAEPSPEEHIFEPLNEGRFELEKVQFNGQEMLQLNYKTYETKS